MSDITIGSWTELNDALFRDSYDDRLKRHRSPYAFRGLSFSHRELQTSLIGLGTDPREVEGHILRNFIKYAHRDAQWGSSIWNWLAVAQHHGVPTRMLDWTYSPYVALHFATQRLEDYDKDAVVWLVDFTRVKQLLPDVLRDLLKEEGSDVFTADLLERAAKTLGELQDLCEEPYPVFLEPPSIDDRIVNQNALFSLMSSATARFDEWLGKHKDLHHRLVIPAAMKWEIRDKLDQANITERVLFPGLDGLSRWLRRYYSPRFLQIL